MKFVFASDSFKGSLTSTQICLLLQEEAARVFPEAECVSVPIADGGEGTLEAIEALGGDACERLSIMAHDGIMGPVRCNVLLRGAEAFVEAASTCGLALLSDTDRDPLLTTSFGVGESIGHALFHGCTHITVGLGGSCMNDGGMGCLRALGVRFFDDAGEELMCNGKALERVARIDESGLIPQAREATFTLMCDVTNPLLGEQGATRVFGPQKGADAVAVERLEAGMRHFADVIARTHPCVDFSTPGYGAAGGLGMALSVFLGARMQPGIEVLLEWADFDRTIADADLVVTGEGQLDGQSLDGKAVSGVFLHAKHAGVPVAVLCGTSLLDEDQVRNLGVYRVMQTSAGVALAQAIDRAEDLYRATACKLFEALPGF